MQGFKVKKSRMKKRWEVVMVVIFQKAIIKWSIVEERQYFCCGDTWKQGYNYINFIVKFDEFLGSH
jgi:hypothetical protein